MHDLLRIHELGARRVRWRYDDPSGVTDVQTGPVHPSAQLLPTAAESRLRVRRPTTPRVVS